MLDRPKVMQSLQESADKLFIDLSSEFNCAQEVWESITQDPFFAQKVASLQAPWLIPSWTGNLDDTFATQKPDTPLIYQVFSVDGSQIYPDRHQGTSCSLINIGSTEIAYGKNQNVFFNSKPFVYIPDESNELENPLELVNCRRQELEFVEAIAIAHTMEKAKEEIPILCLFDGSLIFWHLEGKEQTIKDHFVAKYLQSLQAFYEMDIPIVGYISLPKSKELVNLIRLQLSNFDPHHNKNYKKIEHLVDTHVVGFFLEPGERTTLFSSNSSIVSQYPAHLKPHFFYLHLGHEIVRIELPQWLTHEKDRLDHITRIIIDQSIKGRGYPVCLAEAHEQAVVKGPDRDFFYHIIQKIGYQHKQQVHISQKSLKKRGIGI